MLGASRLCKKVLHVMKRIILIGFLLEFNALQSNYIEVDHKNEFTPILNKKYAKLGISNLKLAPY